jgi:hypothetical protein
MEGMDGNYADMATIVIAVIAVLIRPIRRRYRGLKADFTLRDSVIDFLNGTVIVPFLLLVFSVFSSAVLQEALKANKVAMAAGGVIGLLFIFRELSRDAAPGDAQ